MKREGYAPEASVFLPQASEEQDFRYHEFEFVQTRGFIFIFPPIHFFHVRPTIKGPFGCFMLNRVDFPADMQWKSGLSVYQIHASQREHSDAKICENIKSHRMIPPAT